MRKLLITFGLCLFGGAVLPELVPALDPLPAATAGLLETGTTNPADLPAMARLRMAQDWPGWTVDSAVTRSNFLSVAVVAHNVRGQKNAFSVPIIVKNERGRTVYYVGRATTQQ